jgi:hypothetical protein
MVMIATRVFFGPIEGIQKGLERGFKGKNQGKGRRMRRQEPNLLLLFPPVIIRISRPFGLEKAPLETAGTPWKCPVD